jgi:hypothetical protein
LNYTRKRWLKNINDNEKISKTIRAHFFAQTLAKCRDDHSIGRLWWNYRIAAMLLPDDPAQALSIFLERADIRSNLIERSRAGGRIPLARAILAALIANPEVRKNENAFRTFMKAINLRAAGLMFELLDQRKRGYDNQILYRTGPKYTVRPKLDNLAIAPLIASWL